MHLLTKVGAQSFSFSYSSVCYLNDDCSLSAFASEYISDK